MAPSFAPPSAALGETAESPLANPAGPAMGGPGPPARELQHHLTLFYVLLHIFA